MVNVGKYTSPMDPMGDNMYDEPRGASASRLKPDCGVKSHVAAKVDASDAILMPYKIWAKTYVLDIYLEPKWGPLCWLKFGPCFWGLTFENRGHLGSRYI